MSEPLLKQGDRAYIINTEFFPITTSNMAGCIGTVMHEPKWADNPGDPDNDNGASIPGWTGPPGWTYYLEVFDEQGDAVDEGRYHELELVKCCHRK